MKYADGGCSVCGEELSDDGTCSFCSTRQVYFDRSAAAVRYEGTAKALITGYKFGARKRMARVAADICLDRAGDLIRQADVITAVPSSGRKKWKRGFNQSEEVAVIIAAETGIPFRKLLKETGQGRKQKTLGMEDRFFNVLGRYELKKGAETAGKNVLLFDDVFTTGATINECSRILKEGGVSSVFSLVFARVFIKRLEK